MEKKIEILIRSMRQQLIDAQKVGNIDTIVYSSLYYDLSKLEDLLKVKKTQ